jgi:hypothetical protein
MKRFTTLNAILGVVGLVTGLAVVVASAGALNLPSTSLLTIKAAATASPGQPQSDELLCGTVTMPSPSATHGKSPIDHPTWTAVSGMEYAYSGSGDCDSPPGTSNGTFSWHVMHSSVNTLATSERGTEHGGFMDSANGMNPGKFNGQVTNWDFGATADSCPSSHGTREVYYASGHPFDTCNGGGGGQGNFNTTQVGNSAATHFRGTYETIVYQNNSNSNCMTSQSTNFCFEAILVQGH